MAGVAKRHAVQVSCSVVRRELYLLPETDRRLFAGIDQHVTPALELGATFEVEAGSRSDRETLSLGGRLTAGRKTVRLAFTNDLLGAAGGSERPSRPAGCAQRRGSSRREPRARGAAIPGGLQELER